MFLLQELLNYGEILLFARFATQVKLRESPCTPKHQVIAKNPLRSCFLPKCNTLPQVEVV